jgi:hypothetical protein
MLTALETATYVTFCIESYTAPVFAQTLKRYCTLKGSEKNNST